jgi:protein PET117
MHQGVIRDMEQQRLRRERQLDFDTQAALEAELRKEQAVDDDRGGFFGRRK